MKRKGFTIVELLVVIAIIGILATLMSTAWRGWVHRQELDRGARVVFQAMNKARSDSRRQSVSQRVTWTETKVTTTNSTGSSIEKYLPKGLRIITPADVVVYTAPFGRAQIPDSGGDDYRIEVVSDKFTGNNNRQIIIYGVTGKSLIHKP